MRRAACVVLAATAVLVGCFESSVAPRDGEVPLDGGRPASDGATRDAGDPPPPPPPTRDVDWLFVVDNSNSMVEEQASLTSELPNLIRILATGDRELDGTPDFQPVDSLQMGVITTDMGVGGFTVPTCARADFGDDGVLRTNGAGDAAGCMAVYPSFLHFAPDRDAPSELARDLSCLVQGTGTGGCGYEQPLEAVLKALSPSAPTAWTAPGYAPPMFFRNTFGHGDGANAGFLRDDSLLVVVVLTDEEDCSAADPDLYNPSSPTYSGTDLSLRCWAHGDSALHPIARYVDGLLQLRRHPSRLVFATIAGVPTDLAPSVRGDGSIDWEPLIGPTDGTRDERMVERVDPSAPTRLVPSCNVPGRGLAFPPVRILRVARELEARGAGVSVQSICQENYTEVVRQVVAQLD